MKILITTGIFPPDIGGPATYVPLIASALQERGHEITVVTLSDVPRRLEENYRFNVIRIQRGLPFLKRSFHLVSLFIRYGRESDLFFVNGLAFEVALANLYLRKPMIQKIVGDLAWERSIQKGWTAANFEEFQVEHSNLKAACLKMLRTWWSKKANEIIVPCHFLARRVAGWGVPAKKIKVIYNGVEPLTHSRQIHKIPLSSTLQIVTLGRLVQHKHLDRLLHVVARLNNASLIIIGDGPEMGNLQAIAHSLGISKKIHFMGKMPRQNALALMSGCDIFVLNSSYEGLSHALLEAMRLGLPTVATHCGGNPEIIVNNENGTLIPCLDDEALFGALEALAIHPDLRQHLSEGALQTSKQFFTKNTIDETIKLLEGAVTHAARSPEKSPESCSFAATRNR